MSAVDLALPRIKIAEGFRAHAYKDTRGFTTIGYGFNVEAGITQKAAEGLLSVQVEELHESLQVYRWYQALDPVRQGVCLDIAFNAGLTGLVNGFPKMIEALGRGDWAAAAAECHVQNPELAGRYSALAQLLLVGGT